MYGKYDLSELFLNKVTGRNVDLTRQQEPDSLEQMLKDDPVTSVDVYYRRLGDLGYHHISHLTANG